MVVLNPNIFLLITFSFFSLFKKTKSFLVFLIISEMMMFNIIISLMMSNTSKDFVFLVFLIIFAGAETALGLSMLVEKGYINTSGKLSMWKGF